MKDVAIIGIGLTPWGKFPDTTSEELGRTAILEALKDANLNWTDINFLIAGIDPYGGFAGLTSGPVLAANMGFSGIPVTSLWNACATGSYTLDMGSAFVLSGLYDIVLCVGAFRAPGGFFPTTGTGKDPNDLDAMRFRLVGKTGPSMFAFQAMRRMHNFGMTEKDLAQVKVKSSKHGALNPYARYQREYTLEEVLASQMLAYPLRLYEIAATSDGAAAIILCSMEKAKKFTAKPVVLASVFGPQPPYPNVDTPVSSFCTNSMISTQPFVPGADRSHEPYVAQGVLERAGIEPKDIDFAEVYDLSMAMELDWIEDIGLCKPGEAESLLWEGATSIGGRIPINPSGGVASFGESVPAQALLQVCEMVIQLRGDAGPRQVEGAKVGFAANKGLMHNVSCIVTKK